MSGLIVGTCGHRCLDPHTLGPSGGLASCRDREYLRRGPTSARDTRRGPNKLFKRGVAAFLVHEISFRHASHSALSSSQHRHARRGGVRSSSAAVPMAQRPPEAWRGTGTCWPGRRLPFRPLSKGGRGGVRGGEGRSLTSGWGGAGCAALSPPPPPHRRERQASRYIWRPLPAEATATIREE